MMATGVWNKLDLNPPPTFTCKLTAAEVSFKSLRQLSDVLWDALSVLRNQETLFTEAAILSRLIYRMKSMFRGDKGFKAIEKVNHCLRHYLSLNLVPMFDNFFRTIPWDCSDKDLYCPTRQMLEYILVRTQGLAALLCRIVHTCMEAAFLFRTRMSSGHNWQVSLLCLGVVSRIWALSKHILTSCVKWYNTMKPFLEIFQPNGPLWLSEEYTFPSDLTIWLDVPWMHAPCSAIERDVNLDTDSSQSPLNSKTNVMSSYSHHITPRVQSIQDDVGVSISRDLFPTPVTSENMHSRSPEQPGHCVIEGREGKSTTPNLTSKQLISSKKKLKRKLKVERAGIEKDGESEEPRTLNNKLDFDGDLPSPSQTDTQDTTDSPAKRKKTVKTKNINNLISSLNSHDDVETLLETETRKRTLTCSLDVNQWRLLKKLVGKLNLKLLKAQDEEKRNHLLEQIKKAFKIALL